MGTTIGVCSFLAYLSPVYRRDITSASVKAKRSPVLKALAVSTATTKSFEEGETTKKKKIERLDVEETEKHCEGKRTSLKDYFEEAKRMMMMRSDGGQQPQWFSPLECGSHAPDSPLLLYLPGIDGVGLGLIMQHQRLGEIFEICCLHISVKDRTSFTGLVKLIEIKVRSEKYRMPNRPIYLVGESLGACLALAVAARNPDLDLVLILANPATSYSKSLLHSTRPLLQHMPDQALSLSFFSLLTGGPFKMAMHNIVKGLFPQPTVEGQSQNLLSMLSYLPVVADILPKETVLWKLELLSSASAYVNARIHDVKAQTLVLCSGQDQLLPSRVEGRRLCRALSRCQIRNFYCNGHFLFLEDGIDLVTIIKRASFYRRGKILDYISDFMPPTASELNKLYGDLRWLSVVAGPVMLSTLEDGKIVRGLSGIPKEGPVLFVGNHMFWGIELFPMMKQFLIEKNILLRGLAHPMLFFKLRDGILPDIRIYDLVRLMGAVPVSATNFSKLLSSKSHVLLYPGGAREALHRKGEEYKLFWSERSEFVRMAAKFGATIVPFGVTGEDDIIQLVLDYNDQMKIPLFKTQIEELAYESIPARTDAGGEVSNQQIHIPVFLPKVPGRFYYYFGKPIETRGRKHELKDKNESYKLYLQVKSQVEECLAYLKEKREHDPYRSLLSRLIYRTKHGLASEIPTFDI